MDVKMWEGPRSNEDAPVGSSLRWSSRKAARKATNSIRSQAKEGGRRRSSRRDGAHKKPAVGSPQELEPTTSDPLYVPLSDSESSGNDECVIGLEPEETAAPTIADDTAFLEEIDRTLPIHVNVKKMCNMC